MAHMKRTPTITSKGIENFNRILEESCVRLTELLRWREEEFRRWDEEMTRFLEEESRKNSEQRQAEQERIIAEIFGTQEESAAQRQAVVEAWRHYEQRWQTLNSISYGLTFRSIPWPVATAVTLPEALLSNRISQFILSPAHSQTVSRKRRIHAALRRWHTDHFDVRVLHKVVERDRPAVKDGVGRVVRCLNELLASEVA